MPKTKVYARVYIVFSPKTLLTRRKYFAIALVIRGYTFFAINIVHPYRCYFTPSHIFLPLNIILPPEVIFLSISYILPQGIPFFAKDESLRTGVYYFAIDIILPQINIFRHSMSMPVCTFFGHKHLTPTPPFYRRYFTLSRIFYTQSYNFLLRQYFTP